VIGKGTVQQPAQVGQPLPSPSAQQGGIDPLIVGAVLVLVVGGAYFLMSGKKK
jgi:hypothetical protein